MADQQKQPDPFADFGGATLGTPASSSQSSDTEAPIPSAGSNPPAPKPQVAPDFSAFGGASIPAPTQVEPPFSAKDQPTMGPAKVPVMPTRGAMLQAEQTQKSPKLAEAAGVLGVAAIPATIGAAAMEVPQIADAVSLAKEYGEYYGGQVAGKLTEFAKAHPTAAKAAGIYTSWLTTHIASKLGIPMPHMLKVLADL